MTGMQLGVREGEHFIICVIPYGHDAGLGLQAQVGDLVPIGPK